MVMQEIKLSMAAARVNAGLTQEETAKKLGISKSTLVNWEKGKVSPKPMALVALADLYGITVDTFKNFCESDSLKVNTAATT